MCFIRIVPLTLAKDSMLLQFAFITQKAIDHLLTFDSFVEVWLMEEMVLEKIYQEKLEERIIAYLADNNGITLEEAMKSYYSSKLADKIHRA